MLLFIRHCEDDTKSWFQKYTHDTDVTERGRRETAKLTHRLVKKYGVPDLILCSPFKRCRSTVKAMLRHLHCSKKPQIKVDVRLSKYYTEEQQVKPNARPSTQKHNPPTIETPAQVKVRSVDIFEELKPITDMNIWCVTHAAVLKYINKEVRRLKPIRKIGYYEFLDHFSF